MVDYIIIIITLLISIAYLTLIERKIMGIMQRRKGPNVVGPLGLLQPFADGLKLLVKEIILPTHSDIRLYLLSPIIFIFLSFLLWSFTPYSYYSVFLDLNLSILYMLAISSLSVYGIIIGGWSSNSKYSMLGGIRSAAQMISYEIALALIFIPILLFTESTNFSTIILKQSLPYIFPFFPLFFLFFIGGLAETNRPPFDLPEAEAELVSGYSTEYSSVGFALYFIAEYGNILFFSIVSCILFFTGYNIFSFSFILFTFIWVRVAFPRYRYDQLMRLGWKTLLPISLAFISFYSTIYLLW